MPLPALRCQTPFTLRRDRPVPFDRTRTTTPQLTAWNTIPPVAARAVPGIRQDDRSTRLLCLFDRSRLLRHDGHHEHDDSQEGMTRRLEQMRVAVEYFHRAGLYHIAKHVVERAEATKPCRRCEPSNHEATGQNSV